ncbi:MAG: hypothetical protein EXS36_13305 [Pedosphaera sp.]|nr:hypothetical protein [Pedosphaera sp.]
MIVRRGLGRLALRIPAVLGLLLVDLVAIEFSRAADVAPVVSALEPWILFPSTPVTVVVRGKNVENLTGLWTSFPAQISAVGRATSNAMTFQVIPNLRGQAAMGLWSAEGGNGRLEERVVGFDWIPTVTAAVERTVRTNPQALVGPIAVDARFTALMSDWYRIPMLAGQEWVIEVIARRVNSPADPFVRLYNPRGRPVTFVEDTPGLGGDVRSRLTAIETGDFLLEVRDSAWGGGEDHRYRVRVAHENWEGLEYWWLPECCRPEQPVLEETEPNNSVAEAQVIPMIPSGVRGRFSEPGDRDCYQLTSGTAGWVTVSGRTRSLGSPAELRLRWRNSAGKIVAENGLTEGDEGRLTRLLKSDEPMSLEVLELNGGGGPNHRYELEWRWGSPVVVTSDTQYLVGPPGKAVVMKLKIQSGDYKGRLKLAVEGILAAVDPEEIGTEREASVTLKVPETIQSGTPHWFKVSVRGESGQTAFTNHVETSPGWRKLWSHGLSPPGGLDGWFRLDVR